jgi:tyrosine-specific transport protein
VHKKHPPAHIVSIAFLITGNLIGAGILALPIKTGLSGFVPSLVAMIVVGGCMYFSALVLGNEAVREKKSNFNYPSLYHAYLGSAGKWIAILANLLILYGLLVAYLSGATAIITNVFKVPLPRTVVLLLFFLFMTGINITEARLVRRYNILLMIILWASFGFIVLMSETKVEPARLAYMDWGYIPATIPIIMTSFHFHNIIPHVCHSLKWEPARIGKTMLIGMLFAYAMNFLWIQVGIGALPLAGGENSILSAFHNNLPSTVPLARMIGSHFFIVASLCFALIAIATSYLANGLGLLGFFEDLTENHFNISNRWLAVALTFGPPLIVSLFYPDIFLKALDVVGGVGIALLFGILPCFIAWRRAVTRKRKALVIIIIAFFALFLIFELGQEFGLLKISPAAEYWKHGMQRH